MKNNIKINQSTDIGKTLSTATTIGCEEEQVIPAISEVIRIVLHKPASNIIKKKSFSNNTVQIRIDEKSQGVEDSLCCYIKIISVFYST